MNVFHQVLGNSHPLSLQILQLPCFLFHSGAQIRYLIDPFTLSYRFLNVYLMFFIFFLSVLHSGYYHLDCFVIPKFFFHLCEILCDFCLNYLKFFINKYYLIFKYLLLFLISSSSLKIYSSFSFIC